MRSNKVKGFCGGKSFFFGDSFLDCFLFFADSFMFDLLDRLHVTPLL